ncbi:MAG: SDR family NAD(P)-dependent oxidoreductase, partial [Alphaproteobacteria bacterium]
SRSEYFVGKTIIITGTASGIGKATALIFAKEGANVVCADLDADGAESVAELVKKRGAGAIAVATDVTQRDQVKALVKAAISKFGVVDFQFNCAGAGGRRAKFLEIDDELWDSSIALNTSGVFYCMQEIMPHFLHNGAGVIVNVASMAHKRGGPGGSIHYAAAKGAVVSLTMGVAREFADRGIRALSISPGPIDTAFQETIGTTDDQRERTLADVPMGRVGKAEEIGELALFMCSNACEFMTADTVYVNGGGGWR